MIQRKSTLFLGIFILIVSSSFLGLPSFWRTALLFLSGLLLIALSLKFTLPKKNLKRLRKKEKTSSILSGNIEIVSSPKIETSPVADNKENNTPQTENLSETKVQ